MPDSLFDSSLRSSLFLRLLIGRMVRVDESGICVDYPGNARGPVVALTTVGELPEACGADVPVLLGFAENLPEVPIVLGFLSERPPVETDSPRIAAGPSRPTAEPPARVSLQAREMIEIGCGESAIILKSDGTIVIRGRRISSRAKEGNKIKGGSVAIN